MIVPPFLVLSYSAPNTVTTTFVSTDVFPVIFTFIVVHIPLLTITFEKLDNYQIFKMSLFLSVRYFITTLLMLFSVAVILGVLFLCLIQPGLLAVWMIFGISLPMYLVIKFTTPIYYRFAKIDFKKISDQIDEELRNEK